MKKTLLMPVIFGCLMLIFAHAANAQNKSTAVKILSTTGKAAVIIVGQTAKTTYKITKFTAPVALKATEKTTVLGFKLTKFLVVKTLPIGRKLLVGYLKTKLP